MSETSPNPADSSVATGTEAAAPPRRARRRFQLTLRALLALFTLLAIGLGAAIIYIRPYLRQAEIRDRILAIGGKCDYWQGPALAEWFGGIRVTGVDLSGCKGYSRRGRLLYSDGQAVRDDDYLALLRDLGELSDATQLDLAYQDVTDEIVASWQHLDFLRRLNLRGTLVRDASKWPDWDLRHLDVSETPMQSAGLCAVGRYGQLRWLQANQTGCDDATIAAWQPLQELSQLSILDTRVTLASRDTLRGFAKLSGLKFAGSCVSALQSTASASTWIPAIMLTADELITAESASTQLRQKFAQLVFTTSEPDNPASGPNPLVGGVPILFDSFHPDAQHALQLPHGLSMRELDALQPSRELRALDLSSRYVDDDTLAALAKFPNLATLNLENSWITDDGLKSLAHCPRLFTLTLSNTRISDAGLEHLRALPQLVVLNLGGTAITSRGVTSLNQLPFLSNIELPPAALVGLDARQLSEFPALQSILVAQPGMWDWTSRTGPALTAAEADILVKLLTDFSRSKRAYSAGRFYFSPEAMQTLPADMVRALTTPR